MNRAAVVDEPSEEQLRLAFRQLRRGPHWPATLELAMAHPVYSVAVRAVAINLHRGGLPLPAVPPAWRRSEASVPPTPAAPPQRRTAKPTFDARRAAANDLDDE
ncbi:MAG TPA: hypothetical protein PLB26_06780 [Rubrivivax sp.]|nr:hypothetical protein [Rubrivivax sp.]